MELKPFSPEWLAHQFEVSGKRPAQLVEFLLARGLVIDATKLSKSMSPKRLRRIQPDEMAPILEFFGKSPLTEPMLVSDDERRAPPMPNAGLPERVRFDRDTLPILGQSLGGEPNARLLFNGQRLGRVPRPQSLVEVPEAYASFVHGTSMEPRYEAGEIVIANPRKPYRRGNYVIAQVYDNDSDPPYGYIKKFVSFTDKLLTLEQLNPPDGESAIMQFDRKKVVSVHRIVGTLDESEAMA